MLLKIWMQTESRENPEDWLAQFINQDTKHLVFANILLMHRVKDILPLPIRKLEFIQKTISFNSYQFGGTV